LFLPFPALFIGSALGYFISSMLFCAFMTYLFIINLAILGKYFKRIQIEITNANIDKVLKQYGQLLEKIEKSNFAPKLIALQQN
jgi:hypothetical protein